MYEYKGRIVSVYDGDTMTVEFDLGFHVKFTEKCRLIGIDTPEIRTRNAIEKERGYITRDYVRTLVEGKVLKVRTQKEGKYGRFLIEVELEDGSDLTEVLIKGGYGSAYNGGKR